MKKLIYALIAVLTLSALAFAATGNAHAYTYHDGTAVRTDSVPLGCTYETGIYVDYNMLVTEAKWRNNPTDSYSKTHFYQGQKVYVRTTVNGTTHTIKTTVRGAYKPGKYGSTVVTFEVIKKSADTLRINSKRSCKYKAVAG